jgi:hypothetical protein
MDEMFKRIWLINYDAAPTCRFMPARVAPCGSNSRSNDGQTIKGLIIFAMIRPVTWAFLSGWRDLNPRPLRPEVNSCGYGRVRHQFAWSRQTVQLGGFLRWVIATTPTLLSSPGQAAGPGPSVVAGTVSGCHSGCRLGCVPRPHPFRRRAQAYRACPGTTAATSRMTSTFRVA